MAIVVSTKVSKKATVRNRARRRLSGEAESLWQTILPGYDIVVSVYSDLESLDESFLRSQLVAALGAEK